MRLLFALVALLGCAAALAAEPEKRVALVIGNGAYTDVPKLPNPASDAAAIGQALRDVGFTKVTVVTDLTHQALFDALRKFSDESATADWSVVYYAGHGIEVDGKNYLVPVDAHLAVDRDVEFEAVSMQTVQAAVGGARHLRLIILDACRDDPFLNKMSRATSTRSIARGLGRTEPQGRLFMVYSAQSGQVAQDGEGGRSPFVKALLKNIETPGLELNLVVRKVQDDVERATNGEQTPATEGQLPGEELYFRPPVKVASADPTPPSAERTIRIEADPSLPDPATAKPAVGADVHPADVHPANVAKLEEPPARPPAAPDDGVDLALAVQKELSRVGCDAGPANGQWTVRSRKALLDFSDHAGLTVDVDKPDAATLGILRGQRGIVCPPVLHAAPRPLPQPKRASLQPEPPRQPVPEPRRQASPPPRVVQRAERRPPERPVVARPATPRPSASCFVFNGETHCE